MLLVTDEDMIAVKLKTSFLPASQKLLGFSLLQKQRQFLRLPGQECILSNQNLPTGGVWFKSETKDYTGRQYSLSWK